MASRSSTARTPKIDLLPTPKPARRPKAASSNNVVHLRVTTPPEAERASLECACDIVAADWAMGFEVSAALCDYQREVSLLALDSMTTLQSILEHATTEETLSAQQDTTRAMDGFERFCSAHMRLAQRLCDANLSAMACFATLPTRFLGKT